MRIKEQIEKIHNYFKPIKNTGYFKSNTDENRTEFGYNQDETNIDEFFWDIDNKRLEFNAKEGS